MFKKTAIAFGLAIVTGTSFAAIAGTEGSMQAGMDANTQSSGSVAALFQKLDTNNNGVLSQSEAQANPTVARLYDSMNTGASIKTDPKAEQGADQAGGITMAQFRAGMEAASGGTAGPAVSGGQTYTVMKDGMTHQADNAMSGAKHAMHSTRDSMKAEGEAMHSKMHNGMSRMGNDMSNARSNMSDRADRMGSAMHNDMSNARQNMQSQTGMSSQSQRMQSGSDAMDNGMQGNTMTDGQ